LEPGRWAKKKTGRGKKRHCGRPSEEKQNRDDKSIRKRVKTGIGQKPPRGGNCEKITRQVSLETRCARGGSRKRSGEESSFYKGGKKTADNWELV